MPRRHRRAARSVSCLPARAAALTVVIGTAVVAGCAADRGGVPPGGGGIGIAIAHHDWRTADAVATRGASDDLSARLIEYLRLLAPGAPAADYVAFLAANPVWPNRPVLAARYDAALLREGDGATRAALCRARTPDGGRALATCAGATGDPAFAAAAWRAGVDGLGRERGEAAAFRARWSAALTPGDDAARFATLLAGGPPTAAAASDAAALLPPDDGALARARLLLATGDTPDPLAIRANVPADRRDDPGLVLGVARALRRTGDEAGAVRFWAADGARAEAAEAVDERGRFWSERGRLARDRLLGGDVAGARALADDPDALPTAAAAEQLFLSGWIALRFAHDPARARERFARLATLGDAVLTRARAAWWLAETDAALGDRAGAAASLAVAARFPTTFYGQRALATRPGGLGATLAAALRAAEPPSAAPGAALAFADRELPRAAILLAAWGEQRRARAFIDLADRQTTDAPTHVLAAQLALALGLPDEAVAVARRAGRDGTALPALGWPAPWTPPAGNGVPAPLLLAIARQESGFDPAARSPSDALGLMQLKPSTASDVAAAHGIPFATDALVADPALNLRLGAFYLGALLARFGGDVPLAVAAYNAGPHRAASWPPPPAPVSAPASADGGAALDDPVIDWIEGIPIDETRNYVERVLENQAIYADAARPTAALAEADDPAGGGAGP